MEANDQPMEANDQPIEMEIFRTGDYGAKGRYSEADLQALAEDYRPELLEAPLTFDHAQSGPAYGWVTALRCKGDRLLAVLRGVPEAVRQLVRSGAFRQRSVELVQQLKETGRPYLRAVSLLGAATPEVKGLREIRFSACSPEDAGDNGSATESSHPAGAEEMKAIDSSDVEQLVEQMVEQSLPASGGEDAAGQSEERVQAVASDDHETAVLLRDGVELGCEPVKLQFASMQPCDEQDCPTREAAAQEIEKELGELRAQIAALQWELRGQAADAVFAELRSEGYALPERHIIALRQFAQAMTDDVIHFSESESAPVADWLREFLRATAPRVPLGVVMPAAGSTATTAAVDYAVQFTERTDPASVDLHHRAVALMQQDAALGYTAALSRAASVNMG